MIPLGINLLYLINEILELRLLSQLFDVHSFDLDGSLSPYKSFQYAQPLTPPVSYPRYCPTILIYMFCGLYEVT